MSPVNFLRVCFLVIVGLGMQHAYAEVAVDVFTQGVKIGNGVSVDVKSGAIGPDVQMQGVAVINGAVFIDGEQVPKGKTSYTGKKSGKSYQIEWGKDGNVSVAEK